MRTQASKSPVSIQTASRAAIAAARAAGEVMRRELRSTKKVNEASRHDIKLELDVRCQALIEKTLLAACPNIPILGEEGSTGREDSPWRWVVDPIDGTVNFAFGLPHASVSIALQRHDPKAKPGSKLCSFNGYRSVVGVVYDPFLDELFSATEGKPARLNGRKIQVGSRKKLQESILTIGFAKHQDSLDKMLPVFSRMIQRVLKIRIMGSAALALSYVACGRFDGYLEGGLRLWDIAAGALLVESAGGRCECRPVPGEHRYALLASNGGVHAPMKKGSPEIFADATDK